ncbi:MAG TPA: alkaline phosphatase family protein, partial [Anaerolineales bacterium]|nr:alkaline phosphatase family protein [Anaerolineales bacterium]
MSQARFLFLLICLLLTACQPVDIPTPTAASSPTNIASPSPTVVPSPEPTPTSEPQPLARRVIILSIDGLRPDAIPLAPMPNLMELMQNGAYSLTAQTTRPSATLPAHVSMLSGQCPQKHGVDWNDYIPENGYAQVTDIFDLAHAAGLKTVMYVGKEKLRQVTEPESTDIFEYINDRDLVITANLLENFP